MICKNCNEGHIPLGENFVSHDMALDACDPTLEGQSMGIEWSGCSCCKDEWQDCPRCTRDALQRKLDIAVEAMVQAKNDIEIYNISRLSHHSIDEAYDVITNALSEIEKGGKDE